MRKSTELFMGMRSLFRLYDKMLKKVCTKYDLTIAEADIISFLQNNPEKDTAGDIVELRRLSKGAVSKAVESLIQKSLLERTEDAKDRRKIHLALKPQAGPVMESINEVREDFVDTVLDGFTKEELKLYSLFFDRLFENIKKVMERNEKL
ncbi:MAG TPA: MarR family transcriptional regulator [Candidatus Mediterraneibacter pullistercoris]|nr:MarR family transcriptional regulator [Candidatus Mediterraneibacter pullistercoris]